MRSNRRDVVLLACLVVPLSAGRFAGAQGMPGQALQRPRFQVGDQILAQVSLVIADGKLVVKKDQEDVNLATWMKTTQCALTTIARVEEGRPVETVERRLAGGSLMRFTKTENGQSETTNEFDDDPLLDVTVQYKDQGGSWEGSVVEGEATAKIKQLIQDYTPPEQDSLLPEKPVKPGDTWTVHGMALRRFISDAIKFSGKADCTYERIVVLAGRRCGLVRFDMEIEATTLDDDKNETKIRMGLTGQSWFDLKSFLEVKGQGKGSMIIDGQAGGLPSKITGAVEVKTAARKLRAAD